VRSCLSSEDLFFGPKFRDSQLFLALIGSKCELNLRLLLVWGCFLLFNANTPAVCVDKGQKAGNYSA
jgi:hypothetical protein